MESKGKKKNKGDVDWKHLLSRWVHGPSPLWKSPAVVTCLILSVWSLISHLSEPFLLWYFVDLGRGVDLGAPSLLDSWEGSLWWLILCVSLIWTWGSQMKCYFWVYLWGSFQMRLAFESMDWVKHIALPVWVGTMQSTEGLNRRKRWSKRELL